MESALGTALRTRREALGMDVDDLARAAHISAQYIRALEDAGYDIFPAKVYAQGAVRRMSHIFESNDGEELIVLLNREWPSGIGEATDRAAPTGSQRPFAGLHLSPRRIGLIGISAFSLVLLGFWGLRLFLFTLPPLLAVEIPAPYSRITAPVLTVAGATEKESRLTVNGREINIDERGNFNEEIELPLGANTLRFASQSRFGKTSEEVRYVFVE